MQCKLEMNLIFKNQNKKAKKKLILSKQLLKKMKDFTIFKNQKIVVNKTH